jgi:16S rRNA U1498 N3-methylase RsmE
MGFTWAASKGRFNSQYSMRPGDRKRFGQINKPAKATILIGKEGGLNSAEAMTASAP